MAAVDLIVPGSLDTLTGGYIYDRRIFEGLAAGGWTTRVHSLAQSFPEPDEAALEQARTIIERIPAGRLVVIDGLALTGLLPLLDAARRRLRLVALIHHPLALESGLGPAARARLRDGERAALRRTDQIIVTSRWTRRALADYAVDPSRIAVVEPGVDRPSTMPQRAPGATLRLLSVGTVTPRKGHLVLIDALARLTDRPWTLRCAGSLERDPATAQALVERIESAGLSARVTLLGELDPVSVAAEYAQADLFVLPSLLEGYGMVITEAIAHGLPVVASAAGAIVDTLPPAAGRLVAPGDAAELATALATLCDDRERLAALTRGATEAAGALPTWQSAAARFGAALGSIAQ